MEPIKRLMDEHRVIEHAIDILDRIVTMIEEGKKVDTSDIRNIIDFIRTFADKCHHGKEEGIFFPRMVEKGVPKEGGPIGVMLEEHEIGRDAVRRMQRAVELIEEGKEDAKKDFIRAALDYITLLRNHIDKEDNVLFPIAKNLFSSEEIESIMSEFDRVEREDIGEGVHEKYEELIHSLLKKYLHHEEAHHIH